MKNWSRPSSSPPSPDPGGSAEPPVAGLVDAHVHVFPPDMVQDRERYLGADDRFSSLYGSPRARMATAEDVLEQMDMDGVSVSVVFGFAFKDQGLCRWVNDYVIEAVRDHPDRLAGLACVSPEIPGARAELERCLDAGLRGCGELAPESLETTASAGWRTVGECLRERGVPLLVHASEPVGHSYPGKGRFTPEDCLALAGALPGLTIVFGHMGGGLFVYELMPEVRDTLSTVFYDTAAVPYLYRAEVYAVATACAGAGKVLFGSDYPLLAPARYLEALQRLTPAEYASVTGDNARRVFGL